MRLTRKSKVIFANESIEKEFLELGDNNETKKYIQRALEDLKQNAFSGIQIPKKIIPKIYVQKYKVTNLWKYDLPDGWRLVYSITAPNKIKIISIILEWFSHQDYERRFNY